MREFPLKVFQPVYIIIENKNERYVDKATIYSIIGTTEFNPMDSYDVEIKLTCHLDKSFGFFYYNDEWKQDSPELDRIYLNKEAAEKALSQFNLYESRRIYKDIESLKSLKDRLDNYGLKRI